MARIQWQRFEWKSGADAYAFEVSDGGLFGALCAPDGRKVTLPLVAWEGMLDSVAMARKGRSQSERQQPDRSGARWSDPEVIRLEREFKVGKSIAQLAQSHARSRDAIEHQLEKLGLWNRFERRPLTTNPPFAGAGNSTAENATGEPCGDIDDRGWTFGGEPAPADCGPISEGAVRTGEKGNLLGSR